MNRILSRHFHFFFSALENPYSWHLKYNLLFIDQPVGTGYSYSDPDGYCTNMTQVADHLYVGLRQFFELFPWLHENPFYITGESFAGKYIPAIGNKIHEENKDEEFVINLQVSTSPITVFSVCIFLILFSKFFSAILNFDAKRAWHWATHYPIHTTCWNTVTSHTKRDWSIGTASTR